MTVGARFKDRAFRYAVHRLPGCTTSTVERQSRRSQRRAGGRVTVTSPSPGADSVADTPEVTGRARDRIDRSARQSPSVILHELE